MADPDLYLNTQISSVGQSDKLRPWSSVGLPVYFRLTRNPGREEGSCISVILDSRQNEGTIYHLFGTEVGLPRLLAQCNLLWPPRDT